MKIIRLFLVFMLSSLILISCRSSKSQEMINALLVSDGYEENGISYVNFEKQPKETIQQLIETIDIEKRGLIGLTNPLSSRHFPRVDCYIGVRSAFAIEYMIAGPDRIKTIGHGLITKMQEDQIIFERLTMPDMKEIKQIYAEWWQRNQRKSLEQLRQEWNVDNHVLKSDKFKWY